MYKVDKSKFEKSNSSMVITPSTKRNYLHFYCQQVNKSYLTKDKKKLIPRKQKYKEKFF